MRGLAAALAALLVAGSPAGAAEGWIFRPAQAGGGTAGFAVGGAFRGLWLSCAPGGSGLLSVATGATALQGGVDQTSVVTVDGIAFLQRMRVAAGSGPALSRAMPAAEFADLANRLAKGRKAEVSTPAGRFDLPLAGSGKAVQALLAACR